MLSESAGMAADCAEAEAPAPLVAASVAVISSTGSASPESGVWGAEGMAATAGSLRWWNQEHPETATRTRRPADRRADGMRIGTLCTSIKATRQDELTHAGPACSALYFVRVGWHTI